MAFYSYALPLLARSLKSIFFAASLIYDEKIVCQDLSVYTLTLILIFVLRLSNETVERKRGWSRSQLSFDFYMEVKR